MSTWKLPERLGGGQIEAVEHKSVNYSLRHQYRGDGFALWVDSKLTEVLPPLPDEPEPGAYLIGNRLAVRFPGTKAVPCWLYDFGRAWHKWPDVWRDLGGPDITIVRLVPEEEDLVNR